MEADPYYYFLSIQYSKCIVKDATALSENAPTIDITKLEDIERDFTKEINITYDYEDLKFTIDPDDESYNDEFVSEIVLYDIIGIESDDNTNKPIIIYTDNTFVIYLDSRHNPDTQINIFFKNSRENPIIHSDRDILIVDFFTKSLSNILLKHKINFTELKNDTYDCVYICPTSVEINNNIKTITPIGVILLDENNRIIDDAYIESKNTPNLLFDKLKEYKSVLINKYDLPYLTKTIIAWFRTYFYSYFNTNEETTILNQIVNDKFDSYEILKHFYMKYMDSIYASDNGHFIKEIYAANSKNVTDTDIKNILTYRPDKVIDGLSKTPIIFSTMAKNIQHIYKNITGLNQIITEKFNKISPELKISIMQESNKIEEKINNSIITYLKINSVNKSGIYNYMRYRINYSTDRKNLIVNYNDDFGVHYGAGVQTNRNGQEKFEKGLYPNYFIGKFTKIFLPTETNTYIATKQMEHILNKTNPADPKASPLPIFIVGYGSSGAGKTSNLIYFRTINEQGEKEGEEGILPILCKEIILKNKTKRINFKTLKLQVKEYSVYSKKKTDNYEIYEFDKDLKLTKDTEVVIKHPYRFNYDFTNLESDYNIILENGKYTFRRGTSLGEIIIFLVDVDRLVKATTNNPQSSRSHVLVFVDIFFEKEKGVNKDVNLIVGDFAGIENKFNCDLTETIATLSKQVNTLLVNKKDHDGLNFSYYENEPIWDGNLNYWDNDETLDEAKLNVEEQTFMNTVFKKNDTEKLYRLKYGIDYLENNKNDSYSLLYEGLKLEKTTDFLIKDLFETIHKRITKLIVDTNTTVKNRINQKVSSGLDQVSSNFKEFKDTKDGQKLSEDIQKKKTQMDNAQTQLEKAKTEIDNEYNRYINANKPDKKECEILQQKLDSMEMSLNAYKTANDNYEQKKIQYNEEIRLLEVELESLRIKNIKANDPMIMNHIRDKYIQECDKFLNFENHSIEKILTYIFTEHNKKIKDQINTFIKRNNIKLKAPLTTGILTDEAKILIATYGSSINFDEYVDYKLLAARVDKSNLILKEYTELISQYYAIPRFFELPTYEIVSNIYIAPNRRIPEKGVTKDMRANILYLMFSSSKFNKCFDAHPNNTEILIKKAIIQFLSDRGIPLENKLTVPNEKQAIHRIVTVNPPPGSGGAPKDSNVNQIEIENDFFKIKLNIFIGNDLISKSGTDSNDPAIQYIKDNVYNMKPANNNYLGTNITYLVTNVEVKPLTEEKYKVFFDNHYIKEIDNAELTLTKTKQYLRENTEPNPVADTRDTIKSELYLCKTNLSTKEKKYNENLNNIRMKEADLTQNTKLIDEYNRLKTKYSEQENEAIAKKQNFNKANESEPFRKAIEEKIKTNYGNIRNIDDKEVSKFKMDYGGFSTVQIDLNIPVVSGLLYRETLLNNENNDDHNKLIYYFAAKLIIHKAIKEACIHRMNEGEWINNQLKDLRYAIEIIVKSKDLDVFYNYNNECITSKDYKPKSLSVTSENDIDTVINDNIFIKDIINHIYLDKKKMDTNGYETDKDHEETNSHLEEKTNILKQMIICVYCVFNYGYKEIEEKPVFQYPYLNIDKLKKVSFDTYSQISYPDLLNMLKVIKKKVTTSDLLKETDILNNNNFFVVMQRINITKLKLPDYLQCLIDFLKPTNISSNNTSSMFTDIYNESTISEKNEQNKKFLKLYYRLISNEEEKEEEKEEKDILFNNSILQENINFLNEVITKVIWESTNTIASHNTIKDGIQQLVEALITHIDVCNSTTPMGSLEFLDSIAKLNTTNYFCKIKAIPKEYQTLYYIAPTKK